MQGIKLMQSVQECVFDSGKSIKVLAKEVRKPYSTFLREINPYDPGAKLGAETLLKLMLVTRDPRPLRFMAGLMGYRLVRDETISAQCQGELEMEEAS